jgi:hypothetical protein
METLLASEMEKRDALTVELSRIDDQVRVKNTLIASLQDSIASEGGEIVSLNRVRRGGQTQLVVDHITELLTESGPMHHTQIRKEFLSRGWVLPGHGDANHIISCLCRGGFKRVAPGTYSIN